MSDELPPLITKYRPLSFEAMVGHEDVVKSLRRALKQPTRPHAFLLTGPSGTGKTTLARIIARELEAEVRETDAAANSGVDSTRAIISMSEYMPMSGAQRLMLILDECHRFSKGAWDTLLKTLEEPPSHLFISLCTTEPQKVPETIATRCYPIKLRALTNIEISSVLADIIEIEGWSVNSDVLQTIISSSQGSPRRAINILQAVYDMKSREDVLHVINVLDSADPMIEVVKLLIRGNTSWMRIRELLLKAEIDDYSIAGESIARYLAQAMTGSQNEDDAQRVWVILDAFLFPTQTWDPKAAFFDAIGKVLWSK